MLLDIDDDRLRVRLTVLAQDRMRLTLDYPRQDAYRQRVFDALADLLRTCPPRLRQGKRRRKVRPGD